MNTIVFTKRVPATQEEELRITGEGKAVDLSKVPFKVNDWDNYSVEEAVRIVEKSGGAVTAVSSFPFPSLLTHIKSEGSLWRGGLCVCPRSAAPDSAPLPVPTLPFKLQKRPGRDKSIPIAQTAQQNFRHLFSIPILIKILYIVFSVDRTDLSLYTESHRRL